MSAGQGRLGEERVPPLVSSSVLEDDCLTLKTEVCRVRPAEQDFSTLAFIEQEFSYRNCCNDNSREIMTSDFLFSKFVLVFTLILDCPGWYKEVQYETVVSRFFEGNEPLTLILFDKVCQVRQTYQSIKLECPR